VFDPEDILHWVQRVDYVVNKDGAKLVRCHNKDNTNVPKYQYTFPYEDVYRRTLGRGEEAAAAGAEGKPPRYPHREHKPP